MKSNLLPTGCWLRRAGIFSALALLAVPVMREGSSRSRLNRLAESQPLPVVGREVYIAEGCIHCHTQYVRPGTEDELLWGPAANPAKVLKETPPLIGSRRQGPDLMNIGNRRSAQWNSVHLRNPRLLVPGSRMPSYAHLFEPGDKRGEALVAYLQTLGAETVPQRSAQIRSWKPAPNTKACEPAQAAALYQASCAVCHGLNGGGDGTLSNTFGGEAHGCLAFTAAASEETARLIKFGKQGTVMPGNETLTDAELLGLVQYIATLPRKENHP